MGSAGWVPGSANGLNPVPNGTPDLKKLQYFALISHSYVQLLFRNL